MPPSGPDSGAGGSHGQRLFGFIRRVDSIPDIESGSAAMNEQSTTRSLRSRFFCSAATPQALSHHGCGDTTTIRYVGSVTGDTPASCDWWPDAPCGYLITTDDSTIEAVNDTFLHWTGYQRDQLVGTRLQKLFPIGDRILYATHCQPLLSMVGAVAEIALEVTVADGSRRAALLSAARTAAADDAPATVRVIIFSAHERRRYEKELLAARRAAQQSEAERADAEAGLQHLALHDQLTGTLNRAGLNAHLHRLFAGPPKSRSGLALLFIDLDHFKAINDSLGHAAGDDLISVVAQRLRATIRGTATIARLAGDEFVVLDIVGDATDLMRIAQRFLEAINAPVTIDGIEIVPSASIGAARTEPGDTSEQLLRHADIAMYRAKALGRNTWHLHDPGVSDPATDRLRVIGELRQGIERGELRVHYQPRIELRTGRGHSAEALVRWQHPTRGLLSPFYFVDIAEGSGLIRKLGAHVLGQAVAQAAAWHRADPSHTDRDGGEPLTPPTHRSEHGENRHRHPAAVPHAPRAVDAGDHRDRPHNRPRRGDGAPSRAQRPRRGAGRGRLRNRLLQPHLPQTVPHPRTQNRLNHPGVSGDLRC